MLSTKLIFRRYFFCCLFLWTFFFSVTQHAASFLIFTWDDVFESCYNFLTYTNFVLHSCEMKITSTSLSFTRRRRRKKLATKKVSILNLTCWKRNKSQYAGSMSNQHSCPFSNIMNMEEKKNSIIYARRNICKILTL